MQVVRIYVQVGSFCHDYAAVPQQTAQGINIAAVHQKALGEIVAETMWMDFFQTNTLRILTDIRFKI